jgi:site-specific DNA recombinase
MRANNKLRYIAYIRKSEERKERQELSHSAQIRRIKESFPDLNIVKWMEPESQSAFKPGRPIFNEMLGMIERGEADGIIAYHPNRIARNEYDAARITYGLRGPIKDLKFCTYNFDNSPEGIMMLQMIMNQSQYESSKQGRDVKRGMEEKALSGERPGVVPQGYLKIPKLDMQGRVIIRQKDKKVVTETGKDPDRFDMVKKMWRMLLSGTHNASQIRKIANNDWGYRTHQTTATGGKPLSTSMIYRMFNNPFYAGYIQHNGKLMNGNHEAMITLEEFDFAQSILKEKGKPRSGVNKYAYTGLIKCGECGCSIVAKTNSKFVKSENRIKTYVHYYCTRKSDLRPCTQNVYTNLESIESQIDEELKQYTIIPEFRDMALSILKRNNKIEIKDRTSIYKSQQARRENIQKQLDKLVDMRTRDLLSDDEYLEQKSRLNSEKLAVDESMRNTEQRADDWLELTEKAFDFATYARIHFNEGSIEKRREILRTLGSRLTLKDNKLTIEPNGWLVPIKERYPELKKRYLKVATNKKASVSDRDEAMLPIFESWRARRDSNPRHPA